MQICPDPCPQRTPTCHCTCQHWKEHERLKRAEYEERVRNLKMQWFCSDGRRRCQNAIPFPFGGRKPKE